MRRGVRLGIDVGRARVGVAKCDADGLLATPVETVPRGARTARRIAQLAAREGAFELIVGLPRSLSGAETASTADARELAGVLATACGLPARLVDERLSTVTAGGALRASGRTSRDSRSIIDQQAAVIILQHALDIERSLGAAPGEGPVLPRAAAEPAEHDPADSKDPEA